MYNETLDVQKGVSCHKLSVEKHSQVSHGGTGKTVDTL